MWPGEKGRFATSIGPAELRPLSQSTVAASDLCAEMEIGSMRESWSMRPKNAVNRSEVGRLTQSS